MHEDPVNNEPKGDDTLVEVSQSLDGWEDPGITAMKTPDAAVNTSSIPQPKSYVNVVNAERKTPKIKF
ncbi:hypothetical protein Tco_1301871, partial [Tanacetum coccineum]